MTLQELLEHAHLDALGQLDEREQAAFEAAFAVAPPAIKAQVRNEQSRWAPMEHLLPQVEPAPELRDRVLNAVTAAMVAHGAGELPMRQSRRVAPAWRAASIGLLTAVVVLASAFVYMYQTTVQNSRSITNDLNMDYLLHAFRGNVGSALMSSDTIRTALTPVKGAPKCEGTIWHNDGWDQSYVFVKVPKSADGEEYRLVRLAADGTVNQVLDSFTSAGLLQSREITSVTKGMQLAVVSAVVGSQPTAVKTKLLTVTV
jgi:hypothetical protein